MDSKLSLVYLAAGVSERFNGRIKHLTPVGPDGEVLIECSLKQAIPCGFSEIYFITREKTDEQFQSFFGDNYHGVPVFYSRVEHDKAIRGKPWGTAESLSTLFGKVSSPFIVCNGDDLYGTSSFDTLTKHLKKSPDIGATMGYKLINTLGSNPERINRAIYQVSPESYINSLREVFGITPDNLGSLGLTPETLVSMNIFALPLNALAPLHLKVEELKKWFKDGLSGELVLATVLSDLIKDKLLKIRLYPSLERCVGVNYPEDIPSVKEYLKGSFKDL